MGENTISKSHLHCPLSEEEQTNPNLFTCLPQALVTGTTEGVWKRHHAPQVWASCLDATSCASHDRNVPPTNSGAVGGGYFQTSANNKGSPIIPEVCTLGPFSQSRRRGDINHTQRPFPWFLMGQSKPGWPSSPRGCSLPRT